MWRSARGALPERMISKEIRRAVLRDWGYRCYYCAADLRRPCVQATLDHRLPRSRGGTDQRSNLVPACLACNHAKGAQTVAEFRERVRRTQPEWQAMVALSRVLASDRSLARPSAYRLLWACAARAGRFAFPGEALEACGGRPAALGAGEAAASNAVPVGASAHARGNAGRSVGHGEERQVGSRGRPAGGAVLEPQLGGAAR